MTGINGKKNKTEKSIVLFDKSIAVKEVKSILKDTNSSIISLDFESFELLQKNNINQKTYDEFLTTNEMSNIQKLSYELSDWYSHEQLANELMYNDVNLGSILQPELINILVNFIKNFYVIYKITQKYSDFEFFCSKNTSEFLHKFSIKHYLLKSLKIDDSLPLDSLNTNIDLKFKNLNLKFKIGTKKINSLRTLADNISNSLIKPKLKKDSNFFLFSEINTKKFSDLLQKMPNFDETYVIYNRRQPSIWDKESFSLFKNSNAVIENEKTLNRNKKLSLTKEKSKVRKIIEKIKKNENFFEKFFTIEMVSFWSLFREVFYSLIEKRFLTYYYEIILSQNLLDKYPFSAILLQNEVGPNEKILLQIGKSKKIPVFLMQHGLIFDTPEALMMNKYQGVLGLNTDYQLVWGDIDYQYRKKLGFDPEKIIKIGSPAYDHFFDKKNSKRDYVLLATSGPTTEDIFDLTVESITKNIETIKGISKIVTGLNQKLIIKIHPSPDEFDPTELIKSIDPNIQVIKTGGISEIIKNCSLMIVIDFSSVILDAYLLKKPIISIPVKNNGYGLPKAFVNNSCMIENLETLENSINNLLKNDNSELIKNATISGQNYMSNLGNASEQLLRFLSTQGKN
tara:strand:+ start:2033 stop:3907 length:1875 start_codon:yes stop_codon:yes gene_type:complete